MNDWITTEIVSLHWLSYILAGLTQHVLASNISLLRASEVEDIIEGNEDKYKAVSVRQQQDPEAAAAR